MSLFAQHAGRTPRQEGTAALESSTPDVLDQKKTSKDPLDKVTDKNKDHGMVRDRGQTQEIPSGTLEEKLTIGVNTLGVDVIENETTVKKDGEPIKVIAHNDDRDVHKTDDSRHINTGMVNEMDDEDDGGYLIVSDEDEAIDRDLETFDDDEADIEDLENQMRMLADASVAVETYGINPSAMAMLQITGLMSGTALESLGLESLQVHKPEDAESKLAVEALGEKRKEKATQWAAKILHVVEAGGSKIMAVLNPLWNKITEVSSKLTSGAWDMTKAAGATVKAHPYKTIAAVIAAIAATAAVVAFCTTGMPAPGAKADQMKAFVAKLREHVKGIKWPGGAIKTTLSENGMKLAVKVEQSGLKMKSASLSALGWTQTAVKASQGQLTRAFDATKTAWSGLYARAGKLAAPMAAKFADSHAGAAARSMFSGIDANSDRAASGLLSGSAKEFGKGFLSGMGYYTALYGALATIMIVVRFYVVAGLRLILGTFNALRRFAGGAAPATAAA